MYMLSLSSFYLNNQIQSFFQLLRKLGPNHSIIVFAYYILATT